MSQQGATQVANSRRGRLIVMAERYGLEEFFRPFCLYYLIKNFFFPPLGTSWEKMDGSGKDYAECGNLD